MKACLESQQVQYGARHVCESRVLQVAPELGRLWQPGAPNCHQHLSVFHMKDQRQSYV